MTTKIDKYDACSFMHTALRKCCDSPATSAVYNLVWFMTPMREEFNPWIVFGELVAQHIQQINTLGALKLSISNLSPTYDNLIIDAKRRQEKTPERCEQALYALEGMLLCMDDQDLERMGSYL